MSYPFDAKPCEHLEEGSQTTFVIWHGEALCIDCFGPRYEQKPDQRYLDVYDLYRRTRGRRVDLRTQKMVHG